MSVTRFQEQAEAYMSIINNYLSKLDEPEEFKDALRKTIKSYARQEVYLAFAKQEEALARIEEEFYSHE